MTVKRNFAVINTIIDTSDCTICWILPVPLIRRRLFAEGVRSKAVSTMVAQIRIQRRTTLKQFIIILTVYILTIIKDIH